MKKKIFIYPQGFKLIDIDSDVWQMLKGYGYYVFKQGNILVRNAKGKFIPIWRLARRQFNPGLMIKYFDGDRYNLRRFNLKLIRKRKEV